MNETPQRRFTDIPGVPERMAVIESNLDGVKDAVKQVSAELSSHVAEETALIRDIFVANQKTADDIAVIRNSQSTIGQALERLVDQGARLHVVEAKAASADIFMARTENRLDDSEKRHAVAEEQIKRLIMGASVALTVGIAIAGWVLKHFGII